MIWAGRAGPVTDLPEPVPDFVEDLLGSIKKFVDGTLDNDLGDRVSDLAGNSSGDGR